MPTLLSDPSTLTYVLLGLIAAAAGFAWVRSRTRTSLRVFAALVGLVGVVALVDYLAESPREEAVRRVRAMGDAANRRDWPGVAGHMSEAFKYGDRTKATFRDAADRESKRWNATVSFGTFDRDQVVDLPDGGVRIGFVGKISSPQAAQSLFTYVEATFGRDPDGQLRMRAVKFFDYIQRSAELKLLDQ